MNVREFIRASLVDIVAGIQEAAVDLSELAAITPGKVNGTQRDIIERVEFDIAVTVSNESKSVDEFGGGVGGR